MRTCQRHLALLSGDRGDILLGWLAKVVIVFAVLGVMAFDAISISTTKLGVSDQGTTAARAAATTWHHTQDVQRAYQAATAAAVEQHPGNRVVLETFEVRPDGSVRLHISRTANTIVVRRLGAVEHWAETGADVSGRSAA